jgi:pantoate ligase/cytidylate kinase
MAADLNMPLKIEVCPTVREKSGLAISSRNQYLSDEEKQDAALIYAALEKCRQLAEQGERNCRVLIEEIKKTMSASDKLLPQYIKIVNTETLEDLETITDQALAAIAAKTGSTRLIDNIIITPPAKS